MYLGGKKNIIPDDFFIVTNIRIHSHMDAAESERLFYKMLSEILFKTQKINTKISEYDLTNGTIFDYLYHHFESKRTDKMTFLSCHKNNAPNILEDDSFIMPLDRILYTNKQTPICHDKMTHLAQNCVTLKKLFDKFDKRQS